MKKKHFFLSDNDISAAILPNRETWVDDFWVKLSPKVFCSATIKSNQFMSPWWPMKCYWSSGRTIIYNFWNPTRLSVDASRNDAQGEQTVGFDFDLAFLQVRSWTVNCYANFVRWKGLKMQSLLLYCPRTLRFLFWKSVYGKQRGLWLFFLSYHGSLPPFSLGTRGTIFYPDFFFNFDHKYRSVDGIWADQVPGRSGTLFGTAYPEVAW